MLIFCWCENVFRKIDLNNKYDTIPEEYLISIYRLFNIFSKVYTRYPYLSLRIRVYVFMVLILVGWLLNDILICAAISYNISSLSYPAITYRKVVKSDFFVGFGNCYTCSRGSYRLTVWLKTHRNNCLWPIIPTLWICYGFSNVISDLYYA